ncbi:hypothetical protein [Streptomyces sp. G7(2002)]|uniref:hypothetical protein n=1 Tax=Streptomyces sp. G7(2002) TaxID=2971798 RepID=UPI00237D6745|nr:hypothetical protein [Streptomyces sp. G7(2002)]WDT58504.1 hypothetical protein NUT86_33255 [Streptomyces sp. G7(2002)]
MLTSMAAVGAMALTAATPAEATPAWTNWATYEATSSNNASYGTLDYRYESTGGGWYKADFSYINLNDMRGGDGWGSAIRSHYDTPSGAQWGLLAQVDDFGGEFRPGETYYNVKNVWFEVCNWNPSSGAMNSCVKMRKKTS